VNLFKTLLVSFHQRLSRRATRGNPATPVTVP
jgi:hypothetical protein